MKLLVIRHAIAEDKEDFAKTGKDDRERPLTADGKRKMRKAAGGLATLIERIDVLASSTLVRAFETAEIVAEAYDGMAFQKIEAMEPDRSPAEALAWLRDQPRDATIAVVGHEPHLGMLISWLLTGRERSFVELKKGSATLLSFDGKVEAGRAKLLWTLKPAQLRAIA